MPKTVPLNLRVDPETETRLERIVESMRSAAGLTPGSTSITKSDAARLALQLGIQKVEEQRGISSRSGEK